MVNLNDPVSASDTAQQMKRRPDSTTADRCSVTAVAIIATVAAAILWRRYLLHWDQLWTDLIHDRSAHLDFGVQLAGDLRSLRVVDLLRDVNSFRTWPPLHDGLLVVLVMLFTGLDPRFAVLPSLAAYVGTAILALLVVRRLVPKWGNAGGCAAAVLVIASPAFRAFATDVMIEGPGAFFVLLVLYTAIRAHQRPTKSGWRLLALALTGLFFTKYNYWLLGAIAVTPIVWPLRTQWRHTSLPRGQRYGVRVTVGALVAVAAWHGFLGRTAIATATVAAWIATASVLYWRRTYGKNFLSTRTAAKMLLHWHVLPALAWMCLPGKFQAFLWFQSPFTNQGETPSTNRFGGVAYYGRAAAHDYHARPWTSISIAVLVAFTLVLTSRRRRSKPQSGMVVLIVFCVVALITTVAHPNRKSRFLHSLMPLTWVLAGVGVALLAECVARQRRWLATVMTGAIVVSQFGNLSAVAHAPEGGVQLQRPSALVLSDAYLPQLESSSHPAILSNIPLRFLARWTYQERYNRTVRPTTEIPGYDPAGAHGNFETLESWLATSLTDAVVLIDVSPVSPWYVKVPGTGGLADMPRLVHQLTHWTRSWQQEINGATVEVWKRSAT